MTVVSEFMELTGCATKDEANTWLQFADGDLASAVELFLSSNGAASSSTSAHRAARTDTESATSAGAAKKPRNERTTSDSAELARRLQEEEYVSAGASGGGGGSGGGNGAGGVMDEDGSLRKADEVVVQNLMAGGRGGAGAGGSTMPLRYPQEFTSEAMFKEAVAQNFNARTGGTSAGASQFDSVFGFGAAAGGGGGGGAAGGGASNLSKKAADKTDQLSAMFKPNTALLFRGDFAAARTFAKAESKWLIVVLHDQGTFACHVLNRDVWNNELVSDVVQCSFVYWYRDLHQSEEGRWFGERYKVSQAPYLGFIDPRTGGLVRSYIGSEAVPTDSANMVELLQDFLGRWPTPADYKSSAMAAPVVTTATKAIARGHEAVIHSAGYEYSDDDEEYRYEEESDDEVDGAGAGAGAEGKQAQAPQQQQQQVIDVDEGDDGDAALREALALSLQESTAAAPAPAPAAAAAADGAGTTSTSTTTEVPASGKAASTGLSSSKPGFSLVGVLRMHLTPVAAAATTAATSSGVIKVQFRLPTGKRAVESVSAELPAIAVAQAAARLLGQAGVCGSSGTAPSAPSNTDGNGSDPANCATELEAIDPQAAFDLLYGYPPNSKSLYRLLTTGRAEEGEDDGGAVGAEVSAGGTVAAHAGELSNAAMTVRML